MRKVSVNVGVRSIKVGYYKSKNAVRCEIIGEILVRGAANTTTTRVK